MPSDDATRDGFHVGIPPGHAPMVLPRAGEAQEYALETGQAAAPTPGIAPLGIPESPVHLCPNCKYNLTGLIEHRCPECGEAFLIADAIATGAGGRGRYTASDLQAIWRERLISAAGGGLVVAGLGAPMMMVDKPLLVLPWIMPAFVLTASCWLFWASLAGIERPAAILGCGIIAAILGGLVFCVMV